MKTKRTPRRTPSKTSVHLSLDGDLAAKLRAFAGHHGREMSDVAGEALRLLLRGFTVRYDPPGPRGVVPKDDAQDAEGQGAKAAG